MAIQSRNHDQKLMEDEHYITDAALRIKDDAIEIARSKLSVLNQGKSLEKLLTTSTFVSYLKYEIAVGTAETLADNDPHIAAVYFQDTADNAEENSPVTMLNMTVALVIQVSKGSPALELFVASLDRALTAAINTLPSDFCKKRTFILDATIVSDDEILLGRSGAARLNSLFSPPLQIWSRDN